MTRVEERELIRRRAIIVERRKKFFKRILAVGVATLAGIGFLKATTQEIEPEEMQPIINTSEVKEEKEVKIQPTRNLEDLKEEQRRVDQMVKELEAQGIIPDDCIGPICRGELTREEMEMDFIPDDYIGSQGETIYVSESDLKEAMEDNTKEVKNKVVEDYTR